MKVNAWKVHTSRTNRWNLKEKNNRSNRLKILVSEFFQSTKDDEKVLGYVEKLLLFGSDRTNGVEKFHFRIFQGRVNDAWVTHVRDMRVPRQLPIDIVMSDFEAN